MSNIFQEVGKGIEVAAIDVAHVAEDIVGAAKDVYKVLTDAKTLAPAFKTELSTLVSDAEAIAAVVAPAVVAGGTNVPLDLAAVAPALADIKKLVSDVVAFLPTLKTALAELEADVK